MALPITITANQETLVRIAAIAARADGVRFKATPRTTGSPIIHDAFQGEEWAA